MATQPYDPAAVAAGGFLGLLGRTFAPIPATEADVQTRQHATATSIPAATQPSQRIVSIRQFRPTTVTVLPTPYLMRPETVGRAGLQPTEGAFSVAPAEQPLLTKLEAFTDAITEGRGLPQEVSSGDVTSESPVVPPSLPEFPSPVPPIAGLPPISQPSPPITPQPPDPKQPFVPPRPPRSSIPPVSRPPVPTPPEEGGRVPTPPPGFLLELPGEQPDIGWPWKGWPWKGRSWDIYTPLIPGFPTTNPITEVPVPRFITNPITTAPNPVRTTSDLANIINTAATMLSGLSSNRPSNNYGLGFISPNYGSNQNDFWGI